MVDKGLLEISGTPSARQQATVLFKDAFTNVELAMTAFVFEALCAKALLAPLVSAPLAIIKVTDQADVGASPQVSVKACAVLQ